MPAAGHNGGVDALVTTALLAQDSTEEGYGLQAGPYAFFFFAAMGLALVFLLFSMRKHTRRVTFNDAGLSDAERMGRLDQGDPRDDPRHDASDDARNDPRNDAR
jgi:hypothetical protein